MNANNLQHPFLPLTTLNKYTAKIIFFQVVEFVKNEVDPVLSKYEGQLEGKIILTV